MPVARTDDSSHATGEEPNQRPMDATRHSPGVASRWHCRSIDIARAGGRDGNCGCWRRRPRAGSHQLPCVARLPQATGLPDNAACHPVGRQNLAPRSGQLSRVILPGGKHSLRGELCVLGPVGQQERTQSCAPDQDGADGPVPDADSTPIG
jgi:hypothetical protein